mgnify:CR=1 FL=1
MLPAQLAYLDHVLELLIFENIHMSSELRSLANGSWSFLTEGAYTPAEPPPPGGRVIPALITPK